MRDRLRAWPGSATISPKRYGSPSLVNTRNHSRNSGLSPNTSRYRFAAEAKDAEAGKQIKGLWIAELNRIADERYLAADKAGRAAIAAERAAYGEWLQAREAMLTVLYPEQDAAVQELLAEAVRARVIGLCGTVPPSGDR